MPKSTPLQLPHAIGVRIVDDLEHNQVRYTGMRLEAEGVVGVDVNKPGDTTTHKVRTSDCEENKL